MPVSSVMDVNEAADDAQEVNYLMPHGVSGAVGVYHQEFE